MSVKALHVVVLFTLCLVLLIGTVTAGKKPKAKVGKWKIRGVSLKNNEVHAFLGIPFAEPPVGNLRWKPPEPKDFNEAATTFFATSIKPNCAQKCNLLDQTKCWQTSEDCLYLNVYAPVRRWPLSPKLAVMVFVYGGGLIASFGAFGFGSRPFDGREIAYQGNVIVVTLNYRVGALGFLNNLEDVRGNYGLLDQLEALQWVQNYIGEFGGDRDKVTLVGESAGAESIMLHMANDGTSGLFHRVVLMSHPWLPMYTDPQRHLQICEGLANHPSISCNGCDISCLRGKSADDLAIASDLPMNFFNPTDPKENLFNIQYWSPTIDGNLVKNMSLMDHFTQSNRDVPVMIGNVQDEAIFFFPGLPLPLSELVYSFLLSTFIIPSRAQLLSDFPPDPTQSDQTERFFQVINDIGFRCPARNISQQVACSRPVFLYHFSHKPSFDFAAHDEPRCNRRPCHGSELVYFFRENRPADGYEFTKDEEDLSSKIIQYLSNFCKSGNPNKNMHGMDDSVRDWPQYLSEEWKSLNLDVNLLDDDDLNDVLINFETEACDKVDAVGYAFE